MITIKWEDAQVLAYLEGVQGRVADMQPVMGRVAAGMHQSIDMNFDAEGRPTPWTPLSEETVRRRGSSHPILNETGALRASFQEESTATTATVYTDNPKGFAHQYGFVNKWGRWTPARPMVVIPDSDVQRFLAEIGQFVIHGVV